MRLALLAVALLVIVPLSGCAEEDEEKASLCQENPGSDVKTVEVHLGTKSDGSMYLNGDGKSDVHVTKGEKVRFRVVNDDKGTNHDLRLDYGGKTYEHEVDGGATVCTYSGGLPYFTASTTGTFTLYCEVAGHKDMGMKGTFVVE